MLYYNILLYYYTTILYYTIGAAPDRCRAEFPAKIFPAAVFVVDVFVIEMFGVSIWGTCDTMKPARNRSF